MALHSTSEQEMMFLYCPVRRITTACRRLSTAYARSSLRLPAAPASHTRLTARVR